jgi:hypothetical protein
MGAAAGSAAAVGAGLGSAAGNARAALTNARSMEYCMFADVDACEMCTMSQSDAE